MYKYFEKNILSTRKYFPEMSSSLYCRRKKKEKNKKHIAHWRKSASAVVYTFFSATLPLTFFTDKALIPL